MTSTARDLALIPNGSDVTTHGAQYIGRSLLPGLLTSAAAFRRATGRPVHVREGCRSDGAQRAIFLDRYCRVSERTGIWYEGSHWRRRAGVATAAVPGSAAAAHRSGKALDLWSGIDTSSTSHEHRVWVAAALPHGWVNAGRGFGEPWHQENTTVTSTAGGTPPPATESEEDHMPDAREIVTELLDGDAGRVCFDGGRSSCTVREALEVACDSAASVQFLREVLTADGPVNGNRAVIDKIDGSVQVLDELRLHLLDETTEADEQRGGPRSIGYMVRNLYGGTFGSGPSIPDGNIVSMLGRVLAKVVG